MTVRIVYTGDNHIDHGRWGKLNPETRRNDAWESAAHCFGHLASYAIDHTVDAFVVGGDLYAHGNPSAEASEMVADHLRRVSAAGIQIVVLRGNHELIGQRHRSAIERFADLPNTTVVDQSRVVNLDVGLPLVCVPWPRKDVALRDMDRSTLNAADTDAVISAWLVSEIQRLAETVPDGTPSVFAGHLTVGDAVLGSNRRGSELFLHSVISEPTIPVAALDEGPWVWALLSHIHLRQRIGDKAEYAGAPDRINFDEAGLPRGGTLLTVTGDGQVTSDIIPTPARELAVVRTWEPDSVLNVPVGAIVRIDLAPGERSPDPELLAALNDRECRIARVMPAPSGVVTTRTCPSCYETISRTAETCPNCNQPVTVDKPLVDLGVIEGVRRWLSERAGNLPPLLVPPAQGADRETVRRFETERVRAERDILAEAVDLYETTRPRD